MKADDWGRILVDEVRWISGEFEMRNRPVTVSLVLGMAVLLPMVALSQNELQNLTLDINGHQSRIPLVQINHKNYVEVEALARAANGSISYRGNEMHLALGSVAGNAGSGGTGPSNSGASDGSPTTTSQTLSTDFLNAGIEAMSQVREWRSVLKSGVENGYPIAGLGLPSYQAQAAQAMRLASVAARTEADRSAAELLNNEFQNMKKLSDKIIAAAQNLNYTDPNTIKNDPLDQAILNCAHSLAGMASTGQFVDDGSCH